MFGFKKVSDEKLIERIIKVNKYRKYYATFFTIKGFTFLACAFYFYKVFIPKIFVSEKRLWESTLKVGRTINEMDVESIKMHFDSVHVISFYLGMLIAICIFGGIMDLMNVILLIMSKRKDRLLIKLYESANQNKISNETAKL